MVIQDAMPDRLGPYRLLDRIGEGGMGVVHLAADAENRIVAVKVLRPQAAGDGTARRRLAREVETMRRVRSPFVAEVIDADVTGEVPYIVTRYVRGHTLDDVVRAHGPLCGAALQRLACGLASALAAVHAAGVVHRDLKPANVMMVGGDPVVIDFGIAQAGDATRLTETGMFVGTPGYLAPEVIEGQPSGPPADVHAWGATVAFAATARTPYGTGSYEVIFYRILHGSADMDGIHRALAVLVAAALARAPEQRPSAAWLAGEVAQLDLAAPPPAGPAFPPPSAGAPVTLAAPLDGPGAGVRDFPVAAPPGGGVAAPPAGLPGGPVPDRPAAAAAATRPLPAVPARPTTAAPGEVADLLPAVRYVPPQRGGPGQVATAKPAAPVPRRHRLPALAALVVAVGLSVVLPVAGPVAVLLAISALRAGDRARSGLAARRNARGARRADPLLVAMSTPWALARSLLVTFVVAPFALLIAGGAATAAIIVTRGSDLPLIGAYTAGLFTALTCVGPGSRLPRRQLNGAFNAVARRRLPAITLTVASGALAAALVSLALIQAPLFWPVPDPRGLLPHLPGVHGLVHGSIARLGHVGHGLVKRVHLP